ncbi:hypothetical protein Hypma_006449 [Hypsizygus marmoreus]|uniref:Uncharacterized protein n=1 Tax=Hypsizygus marmoreus TaxID=39966 RepID=A0A369JW80_HYPMA|nr:hypothetical protein Hypma_006449 [Hypsizygus marmoreus]
MLRWCQSTVRSLDGCGTSIISIRNIRFHTSTTTRKPLRATEYARRVSGSVTQATHAGPSTLRIQEHAGNLQFSHGPHYTINTGSPSDRETDVELMAEKTASADSSKLSSTGEQAQDSVTTLAKFLSPKNLSSSTPQKLSAETLKALYVSIKTHSQLSRLTSKQLTELLSLMGTLSIPAPRNPCMYFSKHISHIDSGSDTTFITHWPFVLEVANDKERTLGHALNGTDRYWIMRAQLAKVVVTEGEQLQPDDPQLHALSQATFQYLRIWRHTPDPEVHIPYLEALLSTHSMKHVSQLVQRLCKVLELHANPHSRFLDVMWQILLQHGHALRSEHRKRFLSMVGARLWNFGSVKKPQDKDRFTITAVDGQSRRNKATVLGIFDLSAALGSAVVPSYSLSPSLPIPRKWASDQALRTFTPHASQDAQWISFLLLAIYKVPKIPAPLPHSPHTAVEPLETASADWRTVFVLAALEKTLSDKSLSSSASFQQIQEIIRPLWRTWKIVETNETDRPITVTRAIVATFFRVAARVRDAPLTEGCRRFCVAHKLFVDRDVDTQIERLQAADLRVAYVLAAAACEGTNWQRVLSGLVLPGTKWRDEAFEVLMQHYIGLGNGETAYEVYMFGRDNNVVISDNVVRVLSFSLAQPHAWHLAVPFLCHPGFAREQLEELLVSILRIFQVERREFIAPPLVRVLGDTLWKLYAHNPPPNHAKYPIRFFFSIMITSGHPAQAVGIVEAIHRQVPSFFTTRLFLRLARTLVRHRHIHLAPRVHRLVSTSPTSSTRAADNLRGKLTLGLARAGAHTAARNVYMSGVRMRGRRRTTRESLAKAVSFKVLKPSMRDSLKIMPILARNLTHAPTIQYAATLLVRANRVYAARKLLQRTQGHLDAKTKTTIGNTILHGYAKRHLLRNGRLVRHTLRTKEMLERLYGFTPDRVTINIVVKSILRWRHIITVPKVKALFDHMVRCGYPASSRWRQEGSGVPFGSSVSSSTLNMPVLPGGMSFERHVRPMYKMFVKAFFARGDVRAARTVVGILKEEEVVAMRRREERNRARREGLIRKREREKGRGI